MPRARCSTKVNLETNSSAITTLLFVEFDNQVVKSSGRRHIRHRGNRLLEMAIPYVAVSRTFCCAVGQPEVDGPYPEQVYLCVLDSK